MLRGDNGPGGAPKISDARIARLDALGLCWNVKETKDGASAQLLTEQSWNANMQALEAYFEEHGDCMVPKSSNPSLASFVYGVRRVFKLQQEFKSKTCHNGEDAGGAAHLSTSSSKPAKMPGEKWLTQARLDRLNKLKFVWTVRKSPAEIWEERIEKLKEFKVNLSTVILKHPLFCLI